MIKRVLLGLFALGVIGTVAALCGVWWWQQGQDQEWTTRSPAALEEFEKGLDNVDKIYVVDASRHLERALELDPDFVAAKLFLARILPGDWDQSRRLREELASVSLEGLNDREVYLVESFRAGLEGDTERVVRLTDEVLAKHPEDRWAMTRRCDLAWADEDWDTADACYSHLLKLHPNFVAAQNRLGYIAMARGRFDQSEERFKTYRYIAPDQANPHDSLGQLLAVRGRYDEAEASFEEAIRVKDDFCAAYLHLAQVHVDMGRPGEAGKALDRLSEHGACQWAHANGQVCATRAWIAWTKGDVEGAWRIFDDGCLKRRRGADLLAHRVALSLGHGDVAAAIEEKLVEHTASSREKKPATARFYEGVLAHLAGVRALKDGDLEAARASFAEADEAMAYWGPERAGLKLFNLKHLQVTTAALGLTEETQAVEERIREINPALLDWQLTDVGDDGVLAAGG